MEVRPRLHFKWRISVWWRINVRWRLGIGLGVILHVIFFNTRLHTKKCNFFLNLLFKIVTAHGILSWYFKTQFLINNLRKLFSIDFARGRLILSILVSCILIVVLVFNWQIVFHVYFDFYSSTDKLQK